MTGPESFLMWILAPEIHKHFGIMPTLPVLKVVAPMLPKYNAIEPLISGIDALEATVYNKRIDP